MLLRRLITDKHCPLKIKSDAFGSNHCNHMAVEGMVQKEEFLESLAAVYPELRRTALPTWDHVANARRSSTDSIIGLPLYKDHITYSRMCISDIRVRRHPVEARPHPKRTQR